MKVPRVPTSFPQGSGRSVHLSLAATKPAMRVPARRIRSATLVEEVGGTWR